MTTTSQTLTRPLAALGAEPTRGQGLVGRIRMRSPRPAANFTATRRSFASIESRIYLFCSDCHLESSGWELDRPEPRLRQTGAPDRFRRYAVAHGVLGAAVAGGVRRAGPVLTSAT